jgi:hypothetical protein
MNQIINYFGGTRRFYIIITILFIMWLGVMLFLYLKADEVTKDPCSICSKRMGENVICYTQGTTQLKRTYYPNNSISNEVVGDR